MLTLNEYIGDRSPSFIRMCQQSSELQALRKKDGIMVLYAGDYYVSIPAPEAVSLVIETMEEIIKPQAVWIPTANQLLDLFSGSAIEVFVAITDHWRREVPYLRKINDHSADQLLLAWFMRQRYQKLWNGNEWMKDIPKPNEKEGE